MLIFLQVEKELPIMGVIFREREREREHSPVSDASVLKALKP